MATAYRLQGSRLVSFIVLFMVLAIVISGRDLFAEDPEGRAVPGKKAGGGQWAAGEDVDLLALYFGEEIMVETATRYPKPILQVAENVFIVTAAEIEAMNAHTLYEVLNRVPGLFVTFNSTDFGSDASLTIHGNSENDLHRILYMVDGVRLNYMSNGNFSLNGLPMTIIDRIEIIKGPASSTWGSAMGGVVNIITKPVGSTTEPTGSLGGAYGENASQDFRAELAGATGALGYYLFGGVQHSEGLRDDRYYDNEQVYAKLGLRLPGRMKLMVTGGYSHPDLKSYDWWPDDIQSNAEHEEYFFTATFSRSLSRRLSLNISASSSKKEYINNLEVLGSGFYGPAGDSLFRMDWDEKGTQMNGLLNWSGEVNTLILGVEYARDQLKERTDSGPFPVANWGMPASFVADTATSETKAIFLNGTFTWGAAALTPGIRYDENSLADAMVSPSLGITYRLNGGTLLRGAVAKGFSAPYLTMYRPTLFTNGNPDLEAEEMVSVQVGVETEAVPALHIKASFFHHEIDNVWLWSDALGANVNAGKDRRNGYEVELQTIPLHGLSLAADLAYTKENPDGVGGDDFYSVNLMVNHLCPRGVTTQLFGHYIWWKEEVTWEGEYGSFIWDLNISKTISLAVDSTMDVFFTAHNLFDGEQYWSMT